MVGPIEEMIMLYQLLDVAEVGLELSLAVKQSTIPVGLVEWLDHLEIMQTHPNLAGVRLLSLTKTKKQVFFYVWVT